MKLVNLSIVAAATCLLTTSVHAMKTGDRDLKRNMQVEYIKIPEAVDSFTEMFTEGEVYGRLRAHYFNWDMEQEVTTGAANQQTRDQNMLGLGGSMIYKTGFLNGFGATAGFYGVVPLLSENTDPAVANTNFGRAGKDMYRTGFDGSENPIGVFAEAFLEYKTGKTNIKIGRQTIDTALLATNDTKMIPNTFEALMIVNKDLPDTTVTAGYIMSQKLRDHQNFHSIIAVGTTDAGANNRLNWNDDSGRHSGLTVTNIRNAGGDVNPEMVLLGISNKSIPNLKLDAEYAGLQGFFNTLVLDANYKIELPDGWSVTPGVRYFRQMDDGAGAIGGASISGRAAKNASNTNSARDIARAAYTNPDSVDGDIIMGRLVAAKGAFSSYVGYSKVGDKADIIAPWRAFPTFLYTRSMAMQNWHANTESYQVRADFDFGKAGIIPGMNAGMDYGKMNFDDAKVATTGFADRDIINIDILQSFKALPNTEFRIRHAIVDSKPTATPTARSYNETRFEMNYLF